MTCNGNIAVAKSKDTQSTGRELMLVSDIGWEFLASINGKNTRPQLIKKKADENIWSFGVFPRITNGIADTARKKGAKRQVGHRAKPIQSHKLCGSSDEKRSRARARATRRAWRREIYFTSRSVVFASPSVRPSVGRSNRSIVDRSILSAGSHLI